MARRSRASGASEVEIFRERHEVPEVNSFDGYGTRRLARELPLTVRINAVSNDQDAALTVRRARARGLQTPLMVFRAVSSTQLTPAGAVPQINRLSTQQLAPHIEQPAAQRLRACVDPSPGGSEFAGQ